MIDLYLILLALAIVLSHIWTRIKDRKKGVRIMALEDTVKRLEAAEKKVKDDIANIQRRDQEQDAREEALNTKVENLKTQVSELQQIIEDLKNNGTSPELEARIQVVADSLLDTDAQLDVRAPDPVESPTVPTEPV